MIQQKFWTTNLPHSWGQSVYSWCKKDMTVIHLKDEEECFKTYRNSLPMEFKKKRFESSKCYIVLLKLFFAGEHFTPPE